MGKQFDIFRIAMKGFPCGRFSLRTFSVVFNHLTAVVKLTVFKHLNLSVFQFVPLLLYFSTSNSTSAVRRRRRLFMESGIS